MTGAILLAEEPSYFWLTQAQHDQTLKQINLHRAPQVTARLISCTCARMMKMQISAGTVRRDMHVQRRNDCANALRLTNIQRACSDGSQASAIPHPIHVHSWIICAQDGHLTCSRQCRGTIFGPRSVSVIPPVQLLLVFWQLHLRNSLRQDAFQAFLEIPDDLVLVVPPTQSTAETLIYVFTRRKSFTCST